MQRVWFVLITVCAGAVALTPSLASADTLSVTGSQVVITATVSPQRYVVVDAAGQVEQIINNSYLRAVKPKFYSGAIASGHQILPSRELRQQVERILVTTKIRPGILYQNSDIARPVLPAAFLANLKNPIQ